MSSNISLYVGPGADPFCAKALEHQLENLLNKNFHRVTQIKSFFDCVDDPYLGKALFVPGGNAADMLKGLEAEHLKQIRQSLSTYKISYYGSCAGAIFGASNCYQRLSENYKCGFDNAYFRLPKTTTYLECFPGKTLAPLVFKEEEMEHVFPNDIKLVTVQVGEDSFKSVFIKGPGFMNAHTIRNTEVISTFKSSVPVLHLVEKKQGTWLEIESEINITDSIFYQNQEGHKTFLNSSHPELNSTCVNFDLFRDTFHFSKEEQRLLANQLKPDDIFRDKFMRQSFEKLKLEVIPEIS